MTNLKLKAVRSGVSRYLFSGRGEIYFSPKRWN